MKGEVAIEEVCGPPLAPAMRLPFSAYACGGPPLRNAYQVQEPSRFAGFKYTLWKAKPSPYYDTTTDLDGCNRQPTGEEIGMLRRCIGYDNAFR